MSPAFDFIWFHGLKPFFMQQGREEANTPSLRAMVPQYLILALNFYRFYTNILSRFLLFPKILHNSNSREQIL